VAIAAVFASVHLTDIATTDAAAKTVVLTAMIMMADPVLHFLLKKRNEVVHAKVAEVQGRHRSEIAEELSSITETVTNVVTRADGTVVENQYTSSVAAEPVA
jgi:hypothetical protein